MQLSEKYTRTAMLLHWLIATLVVVNVILALSTDLLPKDWTRPIMNAHKSMGITIFGLAIMRLLWRLTHRPPAPPAVYPRWERVCAHLAHGILYFLLFALPITGWLGASTSKAPPEVKMYWFGLVEWPRWGYLMMLEPEQKKALHHLFEDIHEWLAYLLYLLYALHVGGALKHQFIDKHPELQRMLP